MSKQYNYGLARPNERLSSLFERNIYFLTSKITSGVW